MLQAASDGSFAFVSFPEQRRDGPAFGLRMASTAAMMNVSSPASDTRIMARACRKEDPMLLCCGQAQRGRCVSSMGHRDTTCQVIGPHRNHECPNTQSRLGARKRRCHRGNASRPHVGRPTIQIAGAPHPADAPRTGGVLRDSRDGLSTCKSGALTHAAGRSCAKGRCQTKRRFSNQPAVRARATCMCDRVSAR